jgi:5S rRNA maturation endonuclease (ribonuclease M5)
MRPEPRNRDGERSRELARLLRELARLSETVPIVVEGRRDVQALRRLGVPGRILTLHRGKGLYEVALELDLEEQVVLLLDWDARGERLLRSLTQHLETDWERHAWLRSRLQELAGDSVVEVEHLESLLEEPPETLLPDLSPPQGPES